MKLRDLASTIRSKNAGVNQTTFDIIFPDAASYRPRARKPGDHQGQRQHRKALFRREAPSVNSALQNRYATPAAT